MYEITWQKLAELSFVDEMDYIFFKWNQKQVYLFAELVENELRRISQIPELGKYDKLSDCYSIVISK